MDDASGSADLRTATQPIDVTGFDWLFEPDDSCMLSYERVAA